LPSGCHCVWSDGIRPVKSIETQVIKKLLE
jgi:hypothetical protein